MRRRERRLRRRLGDDASIARLLIDSVTDYAIFVLDPDGYIRTWNRGAERLKGYDAAEITGRHFSTFYTEPDRAAGLPNTLLARAESRGSAEHSGWRVRRDGSRFWGHVTITALREDGELVGFAKVTRDLTEAHEHEEALAAALSRERETAAELEQLDRARTRFLAAIVHDLSTPITVIQSSLHLLLDGADLDHTDTTELLRHAQRNADDLERLRTQLQDFARLEGGSVTIELTTVDLAKLAGQVVDDLAKVVDVPLIADVEPSVAVLADELALRRILTNLATNAARFSPPDVPVRIVTNGTGDADRVAIGVVDHGPGISPRDERRIFQEFWSGRGDGRTHGGLGLGLSIVKGYVTEHGGEVWVDSDEGRGATFWFTLRRAAAR